MRPELPELLRGRPVSRPSRHPAGCAGHLFRKHLVISGQENRLKLQLRFPSPSDSRSRDGPRSLFRINHL